MKKYRTAILTGAILALVMAIFPGMVSALVINEFMADNEATIEDPDEPGEYPDWIEIYNGGDEAINMGGMYLTDKLDNPTKYLIPDGVVIPAHGYLCFWADENSPQGPLHVNFRLSADGEAIGLFETDGVTAIDIYIFGAQTADVSEGRYPDGADNWVFFNLPSPGGPNVLPTPTPTSPPSVPTPVPIWYLPAGGTMVESRSFDTYILIGNPGYTTAQMKITYVGTDQVFGSVDRTVPARSRYTEDMKDFVGAGKENVAAIISPINDVGFIVEQAMYFPAGGGSAGWVGSHGTIGLSTTGTNWFLAEGATHVFNEFVHVLNPNAIPANVTIIFFNELGQSWPVNNMLNGMRVWTVKANDWADGQGQLSARVTSDLPVTVSRTMYWPKGSSLNWQEGHATIGVTNFASNWFLPEGATHIFNEYILVANPDETRSADVTFAFTDQDGWSWTHSQSVPAHHRYTVKVNDVVGSVNQVSTRVTSTIPVVAERIMYWPEGSASSWIGGHGTVGVREPRKCWQLPEGATHIFDEYVLVANPSATQPAEVNFTFRDDKSNTWNCTAIVLSSRRCTVKVNDITGSVSQVSATVESDIPVVVERAMYLPRGNSANWIAGHVTVGKGE